MIDAHPAVKSWIRNLDFAPGFWLPTSRGKFYPDFVVELKDSRMAVVEYKGQHLRAEPYEIEKRAVGQLWARKGAERCLFDFVFKKGDGGQSLTEQINRLLGWGCVRTNELSNFSSSSPQLHLLRPLAKRFNHVFNQVSFYEKRVESGGVVPAG